MHVDKVRSTPGILTHRQYDRVMEEGKGEGKGEGKRETITTEQDQDKDNDKDQNQGLKKEKEQGSDTDKDTHKDLDQLALVPQVHADSCHYCAGGLFRAANLLLSDVINHRQRCPYTR